MKRRNLVLSPLSAGVERRRLLRLLPTVADWRSDLARAESVLREHGERTSCIPLILVTLISNAMAMIPQYQTICSEQVSSGSHTTLL